MERFRNLIPLRLSSLFFFREQISFKSLILEERTRWPLFIPILFGIGIGFYFITPPPSPLATLIVSFLCALLWFIKSIPFKLRIFALMIAIILLGIFYANYRLMDRTSFITKGSYLTQVEAKIIRIDRKEGTKYRYWVNHITPLPQNLFDDNFSKLKPEDMIFRLTGANIPDLRIGDRIGFDAMIYPPAAPLWQDGFSFRLYAYINGISATGYMTNPPALIPLAPNEVADELTWIKMGKQEIDQTRDFINRRFQSLLGIETGGVAAALTVGDRAALSYNLIQIMQASGLSHLLAISGLHLGLAAMLAFQSVRWILALLERPALYYNSKKIAALSAIPFIFIYLLLAGATPPTQRAFLMTSLILLAILVDRRAITMRPLTIAAFILLLIEPAYLISVSFQLSFAAVLALIAFYDYLGRRKQDMRLEASQILPPDETKEDDDESRKLDRTPSLIPDFILKPIRYFALICATSLVATLATTPLVAWHFGQFSWVALISNLIAIPLVAMVVMPLLALSLILMPLGIDYPFVMLAGYGIDVLLWIAKESAELPYAGMQVIPPNSLWIIIFCLAAIIGMLLRNFWRKLGLSIALIALIAGFVFPPKAPDILISDDTTLIAIKTDQGYWVNSKNRQSFMQNNWQERSGIKISGTWQALEELSSEPSANISFSCKEYGCSLMLKNHFIAFQNQEMMDDTELCSKHDLVIAFDKLRSKRCKSTKTLTSYDFYYSGWHHIYLDETIDGFQGIKIINARDQTTTHPWDQNLYP